jgi:hypothetical protein
MGECVTVWTFASESSASATGTTSVGFADELTTGGGVRGIGGFGVVGAAAVVWCAGALGDVVAEAGEGFAAAPLAAAGVGGLPPVCSAAGVAVVGDPAGVTVVAAGAGLTTAAGGVAVAACARRVAWTFLAI